MNADDISITSIQKKGRGKKNLNEFSDQEKVTGFKKSNRKSCKADKPAPPAHLTPPGTPHSDEQTYSDKDSNADDTSTTIVQRKGRGKKNVKINVNESSNSTFENASEIRTNEKTEKFRGTPECKKSKNEQQADNHQSTTSKPEGLQERLERAKFKKKPNTEVIEIWNIIADSILKFLKIRTNLILEIVKTGSYYDNTQVLQAAEFDALICIPQSRTIKVLYHPHEGIPNSSLCCLLKNNSNRHPPLIDKISGSKTKEFGKAYLNPRKLYSRFESYIQEYLDRQKDYLKDYIKDLNERKEIKLVCKQTNYLPAT